MHLRTLTFLPVTPALRRHQLAISLIPISRRPHSLPLVPTCYSRASPAPAPASHRRLASSSKPFLGGRRQGRSIPVRSNIA
jgi:hypothetical protein